MEKILIYGLLAVGFLIVLVFGGCIADYVLPKFKKLDDWLGDLARQKRD